MSLQNNLFEEDVEYDVILFARDKRRKRVLVFPPVNNYRRFLIHQFVQERFPELLHTFSIGQGDARRTVVCYKADLIRDPKLDAVGCQQIPVNQTKGAMGVERSPSASPERVKVQRQAKSAPKVEIYRPPAARRARNGLENSAVQLQLQPTIDSVPTAKSSRQRRPDRAVYVPRHRRSLDTEGSPQPTDNCRTTRSGRDHSTSSSLLHVNVKANAINMKHDYTSVQREEKKTQLELEACDIGKTSAAFTDSETEPQIDSHEIEMNNGPSPTDMTTTSSSPLEVCDAGDGLIEKEKITNVECAVPKQSNDIIGTKFKETDNSKLQISDSQHSLCEYSEEDNSVKSINEIVHNNIHDDSKEGSVSDSRTCQSTDAQKMEGSVSDKDKMTNQKNSHLSRTYRVPDVIIISDRVTETPKIISEVSAVATIPPEKKVKKIERPKSKPALPPAPPVKINRDECDWDSLFDDNGDCLDPTLIEELTSAVGNVAIEQPKSDYKPYTKHVEVSSDEFAHVLEIYNFPSEFKTSDLAAVFSPFKNGGFELKWVDDTHCLGIFSSPLIAAEVLASDHAFVKTRPLSEATALSRTKAKRSAEFLQPYRTRPETCAALARRLVTGALGVKLATARQEREHEKNVLREAKEKRRLANKQREDAWEGIIPEK